ncbi:MAG: hypothetical protein ACP5H7_03370, partial [Minisyncoccia bacterium]
LVILEAAQTGCFPLFFKNCGNRDLFDKFFVLESLNDFQEINNKIKLILENEEKYRKVLNKTLEKIPKKERQIKEFKLAFKELLKKIKSE